MFGRKVVCKRIVGTILTRPNVPVVSCLRFQSTVLTGGTQQATNTVSDSPQAKSEKPRKKREETLFKPMNNKLRDISFQVKKEIESSGSDLNEPFQILEEGLSYLNEIKVAERIDGEIMFSVFQPMLATLLDKALKSPANLKSPSEILDIYITYDVAHSYHFLKVMRHELLTNENKIAAYENVINYWVKFIEYMTVTKNPYVYKIFKFMRENGYNQYDIRNLVFFAYVQLCIMQDVKYDFKDALKLLQSDTLPESFQTRKSIISLNLGKELMADYQGFEKRLKEFNLSSLDPNGLVVVNRINQAVKYGDVGALDKMYDQVKHASLKNKVAIDEKTLIRLMNAYYECQQHTKVFQIFHEMILNGIEKPSIGSWDFVIRSMGHPTYIRSLTKEQRNDLVLNIERLVETLLNSGIELTSKTLAIIIGSFANLGRFDLVDSYIQKYSNEGNGTLPMIHSAYNNILIGLLFNGKVTEAESKLKDYISSVKNYMPSSTVMNTFISYYAKNKNYRAVEGILQFMSEKQIPVEVGTYTIIIDLFFKLHREKGLIPDVGDLISSLQGAGIGTRDFNDFTLTALVDGLVKDGINLEAGRTIFEHIAKKRTPSAQLITTMIKAELEFGLADNAEELFEKYIRTVRNDPRIWNMIIKPLLDKNEHAAFDYYLRFKDQAAKNPNAKPNFYTYYFLLSHYLKKGNKEKIQYIINELADKSRMELGKELPRMLKPLAKDYQFSESLLSAIN